VPLLAGVTGPRGLALAGRSADGVILPEGSTPVFVADAARRVGAARTAAGAHRTVVFAWLSVREDAAAARDALRPVVAAWIAKARGRPQLAACSFAAEAEELAAAGGPAPGQVPDAWLDELAVAGDPAACAAAVERLAGAGADAVVLIPPHEDAEGELRRFAAAARPVPARGGRAGAGPGADRGRGLVLRALAEDDLPALDPWFAHPETVARLGDAGWPRRLLGFARVPGRHALLALEDGRPVALVDVEHDPGAPRRAQLALVVAPERRRRGVALRVLDALAGRPELAGIDELAGGIEAGHAAALALARAAGASVQPGGPDREGFLHVVRPLDPGAARAVALEHALLAPEVRRDPGAVKALLHPGFREVGASGRVWDRDAIAAALAGETGGPVETSAVEAVRVARDTVLVTYVALRDGVRSRRSSLWVHDAGSWLLRFHQGTPA
jgi:RimJ/RimL family protein N-acetyltransferase